jgi:hypothetical protein
MATRKTTSRSGPRKAAVAARPAAIGARAPRIPLKPPLESALDAFAREERAELAALRQRYDAHTHSYAGYPGGGGLLWLGLGLLRNYLDDDDTHLDDHGIFWRGQSNSEGGLSSTGLPSA